MTLHVVDCSRHQVERPDALDLAKAKAFGIGAVNIQLDRGRQEDVLPGWAREYAEGARSLAMPVSTYRWLDSRLPGAESARRAFERMHLIGGPDGMAHAVDCEDTATERILRDYVTTMQQLLGRPIAIYSGAWWLRPRGWQVADLTPFLWSAPVAGYLPAYPGDDSPHWTAGYGGWQNLALMQYGVLPLPGTGQCSLSAVRDPNVWAALTGGGPMRSANMQVLTSQTKAKYPGVVVYGIGDDAHKRSPSGHNEDDTPGSLAEDQDADSKPEHRAIDVMIGPAFTPAAAEKYVAALVTNPANQRRLLYVIYNRSIWRAKGGWKREKYTGDDPHTNHVHNSGEADDDENTAPWVLDTPTTGDDMYEQYDRDRLSATYGLAVELKTAVAELASEVEALKARPAVEFSTEDRAALAAAVKSAMAGGEQLAAVVASAIDSRIDRIVEAVNDDAAARAKE